MHSAKPLRDRHYAVVHCAVIGRATTVTPLTEWTTWAHAFNVWVKTVEADYPTARAADIPVHVVTSTQSLRGLLQSAA